MGRPFVRNATRKQTPMGGRGGIMSPSKTEKQRKFFGAELSRRRAGKKTKTKLPEHKLEEFAKKRRKK